MTSQVEGHHVMIAPQQLGQLVQINLCGKEPGAQDQRSSPTAAGHRNRDAVMADHEVIGFRSHADHAEGLTPRQGQLRKRDVIRPLPPPALSLCHPVAVAWPDLGRPPNRHARPRRRRRRPTAARRRARLRPLRARHAAARSAPDRIPLRRDGPRNGVRSASIPLEDRGCASVTAAVAP